jgi:hypothetical protein
MATVDEIVAAAERLRPDELLRLRKKLDRLEKQLWIVESRKAAKEMRAAGVTDRDIDRMVMRRRR